MLSIFRTKPLDQAFSVTKYKELLAKTYKEILLYEISANSHSYNINNIITEKGNKRYNVGVRLTMIALIISIILMMVNKFILIENDSRNVPVINTIKVPIH